VAISWRQRSGRYAAIAVIAAALAAVVTLAVSRAQRTAVPVAAAPDANVLLITVDTLRADRLAQFGYARAATPAFDRLAREGVTFRAAYTAVPLTLPSHATMMTGLLPPTHGVRDNGGFYLDPARETLASRLKPRGYASAAFVSSFVLDRRWGLAKGFDDYYDHFPVAVNDLAAMAGVQRRGAETWAQARQWIGAHASDRFFVWLHLFDPHTPYDPPEPFRSRFKDQPYDGEIAYVDALLSEILGELTARSLLDTTIVILAADHGEGLGDHDEDEHGLLAYDSTLHVPWIIRLPHRMLEGTAIDQPVGLVDMMPTVLDLVGAPVPADLDGRSTVRLMRSPPGATDVLYAETLYPRLHFGWSELVSVRDSRFKLIRGRHPELYDYRQDPGETRNLADAHRDVAARLDQIASRIASAAAAPARSAGVERDAASRLQALGYFSGSPPPMAPGPLADPRDKTQSFRTLAHARQLFEEHRDAEAIVALQQLVESDPDLEPAHRLIRDAWISRGQSAAAVRWLEQQLARRPDDVRLLIDLAIIERQAGRTDRAAAAITKALTHRPDEVEALVLVGEIQRDRRQFDEALGSFSRASRAAPADSTVRMQTARTLFAMGRTADAEGALSSLVAADPHVAGAHYLLAQIAERRDDGVGAEREYRSEIAQSPWDYQARFNLALLLTGRAAHREALALLESIPALAPHFGDVHFYIAKAILDVGDPARFAGAVEAARRGLQLAPESPSAPLGHYVLGDVYRLQGRPADAEREMRAGRELESRLAAPGRR